jgi:NitT/TauT family transport system substrate-binding protein
VLKSEQLKWWIDVMKQQNMLQGEVDLDRLMLK